MSGSSLDGVDLAACEFIRRGRIWDYRILAAETIPYPEQLREKLAEASQWSPEKIQALDLELGRYFAELLNDFHSRYQLKPALISSHGHTILHEPRLGVSLQAGNGDLMARDTGITVVNDFRREDVAQGGQGAPLVPVGDRMLFGEYDGCLNLGGFSNISFENDEGGRIAYDMGPTNMALNWIAGLEGQEYDRNGEMAASGQISRELLASMNRLEYYSQAAPKSLGREWFLSTFLPLIRQEELATADLMATTAEHIAMQVAKGIKNAQLASILITGGGALNQNLIERLKRYSKAELVLPDIQLIQYKEALIFALLGLLRMMNQVNCLASVTGGKQNLSAGKIHKAIKTT